MFKNFKENRNKSHTKEHENRDTWFNEREKTRY